MITAIEKTLTDLAMPCGLIWLGLIALTVLAWRRRQQAFFASLAVLLTVYTLAGNGELSKLVFLWLESDYRKIKPLEQGPYDAVFVLGGGVGVGANGESELEIAGDRMVLGARLYHAGLARQLVTSSQTVPGPEREPRDLGEETARIWCQMGIPEEDIFRIPAINTREELAQFRKLAEEHPEWKRLGLVTSAWHLPRAMRLAEKNNLAMDPLPANFRGTPISWQLWRLLIPRGSGFESNQAACKEILARLAGQ